MKLIIFERTNFEISENNKYTFSVISISNSQKSFDRFITNMVKKSRDFGTFINLYRIYKDNNVNKIAWIKCGELFTL